MRPTRSPDETKHAAILQAAMALFLENGFSDTSMDAIAQKAKVTKQTVYSHYHSKNALFADIINALAVKHSPQAAAEKKIAITKTPGAKSVGGKRTAKITAPSDIRDRLYEIGLAFLNMVTSKEGLAATRLVVAEAVNHPKLAQVYYESASRLMVPQLGEYLDAGNAAGTLNIPVPLSAASYFFSLLKGNYYLRTLLNIKPRPSPGAKEAHVRECVEIFMRVYGDKNALHTKNIL